MKAEIRKRLELLDAEQSKTRDPRIAYACYRAHRELSEVAGFIDTLTPIQSEETPDLRQCLHNLTKMVRDGDVTSDVLEECDRALNLYRVFYCLTTL